MPVLRGQSVAIGRTGAKGRYIICTEFHPRSTFHLARDDKTVAFSRYQRRAGEGVRTDALLDAPRIKDQRQPGLRSVPKLCP